MNEMLNVVVDGLWCQGDRSLAVRLVSASGEPLPGWEPGAHIDVHLPCGLIRQYSLTGDNRAGSYLICVAQERASRGGSRYIHQTLRPGQRLLISAPRNLFALRDDGPVLLLAAGIGITPCMQCCCNGRPQAGHLYCTILLNAVKRPHFCANSPDHSNTVFAWCTVPLRGEPTSVAGDPASRPRRRTAYLHLWTRGVYGGGQGRCPEKRLGGDASTARPLRLLPRRRSRKMQRPLRLPWRPAGRNGRYRRIRVSRKCYRIMAWRYRFPARWGSVGPA
jgi:hypothetical protein